VLEDAVDAVEFTVQEIPRDGLLRNSTFLVTERVRVMDLGLHSGTYALVISTMVSEVADFAGRASAVVRIGVNVENENKAYITYILVTLACGEDIVEGDVSLKKNA
jgi:hypothetical protein